MGKRRKRKRKEGEGGNVYFYQVTIDVRWTTNLLFVVMEMMCVKKSCFRKAGFACASFSRGD